jgi:hypothetical protein
VADYTFHTSAKDTDGKATDFGIPDRYLIQVSASADHGGTRWAETLSIVSKVETRDLLDPTYATGAGLQGNVTVLDPAESGGLLSDPGFDDYAAGAFESWERFATLTSADVDQFADDPRDGADGFCMRLISDGVTVTGVSQVVLPEVEVVYSVHFTVKGINAAMGGAKVHVSLRDVDTDTIIQDEQGADLKAASDDMTTLVGTGDWTVYTVDWAIPKRLPEGGVYLDIRLADGTTVTTPATVATSAYVDHVVFTPMELLTARGVKMVVYSGAVEPHPDDQWELTVSLAAGAMTDYFIRWLDRTVGLSTRTFKAPTIGGGAETILDSVIS